MFYIDFIDNKNNLYGVADTTDGIINVITFEQLKEYRDKGIEILTWNDAKGFITSRMNYSCNYKFYRSLLKMNNSLELKEYLKWHSVYEIANFLNKNNLFIDLTRDIKLYDYSQTKGYFMITLYFSNGEVGIIRVVNDNIVCICKLDGHWRFGNQPSGSGFMYKNFLINKGVSDVNDLCDYTTYLLFYSKDYNRVALVSHNDMSLRDVLYKDLVRR